MGLVKIGLPPVKTQWRLKSAALHVLVRVQLFPFPGALTAVGGEIHAAETHVSVGLLHTRRTDAEIKEDGDWRGEKRISASSCLVRVLFNININ